MRLRVPAVLAVLSLLALAYIWLGSDLMRQIQVMASVIILALTSIVLFIWFVFFSGAPGRTRIGAALAATMVVLVTSALFRVRGFTGDLVPIVEYRFASARALPEAPSQPIAPPVDREAIASPTPSGNAGTGTSSAPVTSPASTPQPKPEGGLVAPPLETSTANAGDNQDWPQYLGPNRSGVVRDAGLATDWKAQPPKLLWRQPLGTGWAGFAVASDIAVTLEQRGDEERVIAYDLRTGRPRWSHGDKALHDSPLGSSGPRSVPTISEGQVFAQGATGLLNALDLQTGRLLWSRNILKDNGGAEPEWGVAISPLVHGGRVIVAAGGSQGRALVAYNRHTGEPAWASGDSGLAYSSPVLMNLGGRDQVVMLNKDSAAGHDPSSGVQLWKSEMPSGQPTVAQPLLLSQSRVLFSIGYGVGSKAFEISAGTGTDLSAKLVWSSPRLKSKFANMVLYEGSIYGLDDGVFVCVDPQTGERRWKAGRFGHGQIILAGKHLLVQTEDGEVLLVEPNPERLIEVARFRALDGKTWNPPALAAPVLLVRNDLEAAAYELPVVR